MVIALPETMQPHGPRWLEWLLLSVMVMAFFVTHAR